MDGLDFGSFTGASAAMESSVFYGWLKKKSGSKKSGTRRRSLGGLMQKWDRRYFVVFGSKEDGYSVSYYKSDEGKDDAGGTFTLKSSTLQMFNNQWMLTFPPSEASKDRHELQFEPEDTKDLTCICRFCEACTDHGTNMGVLNLSTEDENAGPPGWKSKNIVFKHGEGSIGIVLAGDNKTATVHQILESGAAATNKAIVPGLRLRSVNGKSIGTSSHGWPFQMVTQRIKDAARPIEITFTTPPPDFCDVLSMAEGDEESSEEEDTDEDEDD